MINTPTYLSIPTLGSTAVKSTTGLDTANLYSPGALLPAEHLNYFVNGTTNNGNVSETALLNMVAEMQQLVTGTGVALDPTDNMQLEKAAISRRHSVGELVYSEVELTPVIYSAARSTTNPANPEYLPLIKRYDADHTITSTIAPDLVTKYRAEVAKINVSGAITTSWTGTVAGSVITFAANAANIALVNMYFNEGTANSWIQTQSIAFSTLYTGTAQRSINVNGTDYAVTNVSVGSLTITVSGTPTTGSQTCIPYTYRIAGSTTSVMLPRLSGFVGVVAQEYDGEVITGWRKMDRIQGHWHNMRNASTNAEIASWQNIGVTAGGVGAGVDITLTGKYGVGGPLADITSSPVRVGKTTDPRTIGLYVYTHAGRLLA
jgi:hypothetical protein